MSIKFFGLVVMLAATISYDLIADSRDYELCFVKEGSSYRRVFKWMTDDASVKCVEGSTHSMDRYPFYQKSHKWESDM